MSHVQDIDCRIYDLTALEAAVAELGGTLVHNQTRYGWYGRHVGDYPLPAGFTHHDLGKCDHAIKLPNCTYEIGITPRRDLAPGDKPAYTLLYDFYGPGRMLKQAFGDKLDTLTMRYAVCKTERELKLKRKKFTRTTLPNGHIRLQATL
jgi:hypothetical protein